MLAAARRVIVIVAALFVSAGHVACACASLAAPMSPVSVSNGIRAENADSHAHHHAGTEDAGDDAPAPLDSDCSHCKTALLAGDGSAKSAPAPSLPKNFAIVAASASAVAQDVRIGVRAQRLHWAAPPRRTPVSLKIRLRN